MADPAKRRATYDDVLQAPEQMVAEVMDGELFLQPRPALPQALAATILIEELGPPFRRGRGGPGGWILIGEPELHLGSEILVPDLAGWRRERLPVVTNHEPFLSLAPDWACEVLSPATSRKDRTKKLPIYARERVRHVWLIDPIQRTLDVLRLAGEQWTLLAVYDEVDKVRAEPFDAVELDLALLWTDVDLGTPATR